MAPEGGEAMAPAPQGTGAANAARPIDLDELMTAWQCAAWLKKPRRWVIERSRAGLLPVVRLSKRDFRYHPRTVLAALSTSRVRPV